MTMIQAHMQELNFEDWLEQSEYVERVTDANIPRFAELLAAEEDCDSYAVSPAYYAFTGRRGLWLYHYDGTYLPMCWHPNVDGQILVFPPRGKKNYAAITALLDEAPAPPLGFLLARFKPQEISQLKTFYAFVRRVSFEPVEEEVLDWRYPARILSTLNTAQMMGMIICSFAIAFGRHINTRLMFSLCRSSTFQKLKPLHCAGLTGKQKGQMS